MVYLFKNVSRIDLNFNFDVYYINNEGSKYQPHLCNSCWTTSSEALYIFNKLAPWPIQSIRL